jgi:hypothetical protein
MDNLDRTNAVQAALRLNKQLKSLGILSETGSIDDYEALSLDFRESTCIQST